MGGGVDGDGEMLAVLRDCGVEILPDLLEIVEIATAIGLERVERGGHAVGETVVRVVLGRGHGPRRARHLLPRRRGVLVGRRGEGKAGAAGEDHRGEETRGKSVYRNPPSMVDGDASAAILT